MNRPRRVALTGATACDVSLPSSSEILFLRNTHAHKESTKLGWEALGGLISRTLLRFVSRDGTRSRPDHTETLIKSL